MEKASLKVFWGLVHRIDETWRRGLNTRLHFGQVAAPLLKTRWRSSFRSGSWIQQGLCAKLIRGWGGGRVRGERTGGGGFSGSNTDCIHSQCGAASRGYQYLHDFVFFFMTYQNSTAGGKRFPRESADGLIPHGIILVCKFWEINNRVYLEALSKVNQSHP